MELQYLNGLPFELVAHIAAQVDLNDFHSMLLISKDFNSLLLGDFILGKHVSKVLRKWSFVAGLMEDPNLSALEKIKFQLQRKNMWFLPGIYT